MTIRALSSRLLRRSAGVLRVLGLAPRVGALRVLGLAPLVVALVVPITPARGASPSPARNQRGMVVTSQVDATKAGVAMLEAGGNAIDAAVAAAFALGVVYPFYTGIGGGAFIVLRLADGTVVAIDARETAPAAASRDMFAKPGVDKSDRALNVATPGFLAGLALALERFGTMSLSEVLQPAIRLARDGFPIDSYHARMIARARDYLPPERFPETARIQFPSAGVPAEPGWRLVQKDLAHTLSLVAKEGTDAFYAGRVAQAIADTLKARGGLVAINDLAGYTAKVREPVAGTYRGIEIYSNPPPSSGGVILIEILNILEGFDLASLGAGSSASLHVISEAMKLAFADRAAYLGDPDFVDVPVERLISKEYAARQRAHINPPWFRRAPWNWLDGERAGAVRGPGLQLDDSGTNHLSVTDAQGNAVALTGSLNWGYGSGITVPGTGVLLNNHMDDFSKSPGQPNFFGLIDERGSNAIAPGKRPLSSIAPTVLVKDGHLFMVTGASGGPRIISTTLLNIVNVIDYRMDVEAAVAAPRFHHQWVPDKIRVEPEVPSDVIEGLRERGHEVEVREHWSGGNTILFDPVGRVHYGAPDPRRDSTAQGPRVP